MPRRISRNAEERDETLSPSLAHLAAAPLANPLSIFMPGGKRPGRTRKAPPPEQPLLFASLPAERRKSRKAIAAEHKQRDVAALLDHYARTDLPIENIARHCELTPDRAREELAKRGRRE